MFSVLRPQYISPSVSSSKPKPSSPVATILSFDQKSKISIKEIRKEAMKPLKPTGQGKGEAIGFFEQGFITGGAILVGVVVPTLLYASWVLGRKGWELAKRGKWMKRRGFGWTLDVNAILPCFHFTVHKNLETIIGLASTRLTWEHANRTHCLWDIKVQRLRRYKSLLCELDDSVRSLGSPLPFKPAGKNCPLKRALVRSDLFRREAWWIKECQFCVPAKPSSPLLRPSKLTGNCVEIHNDIDIDINSNNYYPTLMERYRTDFSHPSVGNWNWVIRRSDRSKLHCF